MSVRRVLLEPAHLHRQRVQTGTEERDGVVAFGVRRGGRHFAGFLVADGDRRAGQRRLARIDDLSFDGGPEFLRRRSAGKSQQQSDAQHALTRTNGLHSVSSDR